jgi:hypothetical protein
MSRARNLADLLDSNGDVVSGALDNVPPSNDASALTTGTLPIARIADGDITAAKLGSTLDLSGKTVTLPSGVGGKVLQIVSTTSTSSGNTTSSTFVTSGRSISITPVSATSKILVVFNTCAHLNTDQNGGSPCEAFYTIYRGATNLGDSYAGFVWTRLNGNYSEYPISIQAVDEPNTTSSVTYTSYYRSKDAGVAVGYSYQSFVETIYAMEIAA